MSHLTLNFYPKQVWVLVLNSLTSPQRLLECQSLTTIAFSQGNVRLTEQNYQGEALVLTQRLAYYPL